MSQAIKDCQLRLLTVGQYGTYFFMSSDEDFDGFIIIDNLMTKFQKVSYRMYKTDFHLCNVEDGQIINYSLDKVREVTKNRIGLPTSPYVIRHVEAGRVRVNLII